MHHIPRDQSDIVNGKRIRLRVRTSFMDSADRGPMRVTDGAGRAGLNLNRPGYRCLLEDDAGAFAKAEAQRAYLDDLENAWKRPVGFGSVPGVEIGSAEPRGSVGANPPPGAYPYSAAAEGTACTIDGRLGRLRKQGDWLVCVADRDYDHDTDTARATSDHRTVAQIVRDHQTKMADIYDKLDRELSEAWRRL